MMKFDRIEENALATLFDPVGIEWQVNLGLDAGMDEIAIPVAGLIDILDQGHSD